MSTRQVLLICVSIIFGCIIHGMIVRPPRYAFQSLDNIYVFDTHEGMLKIIPKKSKYIGFIPYSMINTRIMEADSYIMGKSIENIRSMFKEGGYSDQDIDDYINSEITK